MSGGVDSSVAAALMIQKGYDYGCEEGENFMMIYRVTVNQEDGSKCELTPNEVLVFAEGLVRDHPELTLKIMPLPIIYHGTLTELYPNISTFEHWHENVLNALQNEDTFYMEKNEPLNIKPMPREGICLRITNDPIAECFKLKCKKFLEKEAKAIDKGEVDIEMINTDY